MIDLNNKEETKDWLLFYRRLKELGINGLNQEQFLERIKNLTWPSTIEFWQPKEKLFIAKKVIIVDIRNNPNVKRDFRQKDLIELGKTHDFEYKCYNKLGNPFHTRQKQENNPQEAKQEYQSYVLNNTDAKEQFMKLYQELHHHHFIILICYCKVERPKDENEIEECHRFWLMDLLERQKRNDLQKKREINSKFETQETITEVLKS